MAFPASKIPIWLDCDPGHDDAFAILFACYHPGIELLGISTVFGNASIEDTTRNASSVLTAVGMTDVPVYQGARKALHRPAILPPTSIHGTTGIDGTSLLPKPLAPIVRDSCTGQTPAVTAMAAALSKTLPRTAWIVTTGCMTNIATLLLYRPELASHIAGISAMAGAVGGRFTDAFLGPPVNDPNAQDGKRERIGNWTPWAEWNVLADPEAAKFVLEECHNLKGKIIMVTLDLTHQVLATPDVRNMLLQGSPEKHDLVPGVTLPSLDDSDQNKTTLRTMFVELLMFFAKTYQNVFDMPAPPLHDPLAVAAVLIGTEHEIPFYEWDRVKVGPNIIEEFAVTVMTEATLNETMAGSQTGRTIVSALPHGELGVRIPRGVDIQRFWSVLNECLARADSANVTTAGLS